MGIHSLTFMGRNLENRKKPMLVQIMNDAGMSSQNGLNGVNIFSDRL